MESPLLENLESKSSTNESHPQRSGSTSSSNQLFIPDTELPDDTFRMSLDNYSFVGENVTVGDRDSSIGIASNASTPVLSLPTPNTVTPDTPMSPPVEPTSPIIETSKLENTSNTENRKPPDSLKLSFVKKNEKNNIFVKPSPVADTMSPAKMLQFEMALTCSTPTMKRAAIDFNFFSKNNFEEYFKDIPAIKEESNQTTGEDNKKFEETPVIVKANTVRHEIGYGK